VVLAIAHVHWQMVDDVLPCALSTGITNDSVQATNNFLDYALGLPDTYVVTIRQLIEWMQARNTETHKPVPLAWRFAAFGFLVDRLVACVSVVHVPPMCRFHAVCVAQDPVPVSQMDEWLKCKPVDLSKAPGAPTRAAAGRHACSAHQQGWFEQA
jgi:hypothetical protein